MTKTSPKLLRLTMYLLAFVMSAFVLNEDASAQQLDVIKRGSVLSQSKQTSARPQPLTPAQKIQIAQKILDGKGQKVSSLSSSITLSLSKLSVDKRAHLFFHRPLDISSWGSPTAKFSGGEGNLGLQFTAPAAGKYLVDFSISTGPATKFTLAGNGSILTTAG